MTGINAPSTQPDTRWEASPLPSHLSANEIHIWRVSLHPPSSLFPTLWSMLDQKEQQRAQRFKFTKHQDAFVSARSALRIILSRYLNLAPENLKIDVEPHGKPYLLAPSVSPPLSFNIAHSESLALLAVSLNRQVGIDLEHHRSNVHYVSLLNRICSLQEKSSLSTLLPEQQKSAFFSCWTRKEAYVKALGKGLLVPLSSITVSLLPGEPATLIHVDGKKEESLRWSMCTLYPGPEYSGALVGEGQDWKPCFWQWGWDELVTPQKT